MVVKNSMDLLELLRKRGKDGGLDGLKKTPEPWHVTEKDRARTDRILASARRSRELREKTSLPAEDRNPTT